MQAEVLSRAVGRLGMTTAERDASTRARASQHRAGLSSTLRLDDSLRNACRFGYRKSRSAIWFQLANVRLTTFHEEDQIIEETSVPCNAAIRQ
jgi:hypothetical protein